MVLVLMLFLRPWEGARVPAPRGTERLCLEGVGLAQDACSPLAWPGALRNFLRRGGHLAGEGLQVVYLGGSDLCGVRGCF